MIAGDLILASASPARAAMLRAAGVAIIVDPVPVDEAAIRDGMLSAAATPAEIAAELAVAKAVTAAARHPGALVLGADQVLVFEGGLLSKAPDIAAARAQLVRLRGKAHRLLSAAAVVCDGAVLWRHVGEARLTMRHFSDSFLDAYLARIGDLALGAVGCYHLEGPGAQLFVRVDGDHFTVLGLPLLQVLDGLRHQGILRE